MSFFQKCPDCGSALGELSAYIELAREALSRSYTREHGYIPSKTMLKPDGLPALQELYELLHVDLRCCRMRHTTSTDFHVSENAPTERKTNSEHA